MAELRKASKRWGDHSIADKFINVWLISFRVNWKNGINLWYGRAWLMPLKNSI